MKSIKRSLSLLLAVVMVFSALAFIQSSVYAVAEDALEVSLGDSNGNALSKSEVKPGEEFTFVVSVNPSAANKLASFQLDIEYNITNVELLNAKSGDIRDYTKDQKAKDFIGKATADVDLNAGTDEDGGFKKFDGTTIGRSEFFEEIGGVQYVDNKTDGKIQFYAIIFDAKRSLKGECKLIVLNFKAKSEISTETSAIFKTTVYGESFGTIKELENGQSDVPSITKPDGTLAYTSPSDMQLTIKPATTPDPGEDPKPPSDIMLGDMNGDGKIASNDGVALSNFITGKKGTGLLGTNTSSFSKEQLARGDINGDGKIASNDGVALSNYITGKKGTGLLKR